MSNSPPRRCLKSHGLLGGACLAMRSRMSATSRSSASAIARPAQGGEDGPLQALDQLGGTVDHAGAGERHVLPGPGRLRVIGLEALERIGERAGAAGWPQAHVDLVERALVGERGQRGDDLAAEPRVVLDRRQRLRAVRRLELGRDVVDEDQVEVRRRRHLAAAELAQRQHRQPLAVEGAVLSGEALLDAIAQGRDRRLRRCRSRRGRPVPAAPCA